VTCIPFGNGVVCVAREVEPAELRKKGIDLRTRKGREREVLEQVRQHGGFTIFWVTENLMRACAATRLQKHKVIITEPGAFPWTKARLRRRYERRP
jgi:hypothetical protein